MRLLQMKQKGPTDSISVLAQRNAWSAVQLFSVCLEMCYFQFCYMIVRSTWVSFYSQFLYVFHSSRAHSEKQAVVCRPTIFLLFQCDLPAEAGVLRPEMLGSSPLLAKVSASVFFSLSSRNDESSLNATTTTSHVISGS